MKKRTGTNTTISLDSHFPEKVERILMDITERKIDMIKRNLAYIRLGIDRHVVPGDEENARGDAECARWLYHTLEGLMQDVERNEANG